MPKYFEYSDCGMHEYWNSIIGDCVIIALANYCDESYGEVHQKLQVIQTYPDPIFWMNSESLGSVMLMYDLSKSIEHKGKTFRQLCIDGVDCIAFGTKHACCIKNGKMMGADNVGYLINQFILEKVE